MARSRRWVAAVALAIFVGAGVVVAASDDPAADSNAASWHQIRPTASWAFTPDSLEALVDRADVVLRARVGQISPAPVQPDLIGIADPLRPPEFVIDLEVDEEVTGETDENPQMRWRNFGLATIDEFRGAVPTGAAVFFLIQGTGGYYYSFSEVSIVVETANGLIAPLTDEGGTVDWLTQRDLAELSADIAAISK